MLENLRQLAQCVRLLKGSNTFMRHNYRERLEKETQTPCCSHKLLRGFEAETDPHSSTPCSIPESIKHQSLVHKHECAACDDVTLRDLSIHDSQSFQFPAQVRRQKQVGE